MSVLISLQLWGNKSTSLMLGWARFVWINKASNGEDPTFENLGSVRTISQTILHK